MLNLNKLNKLDLTSWKQLPWSQIKIFSKQISYFWLQAENCVLKLFPQPEFVEINSKFKTQLIVFDCKKLFFSYVPQTEIMV